MNFNINGVTLAVNVHEDGTVTFGGCDLDAEFALDALAPGTSLVAVVVRGLGYVADLGLLRPENVAALAHTLVHQDRTIDTLHCPEAVMALPAEEMECLCDSGGGDFRPRAEEVMWPERLVEVPYACGHQGLVVRPAADPENIPMFFAARSIRRIARGLDCDGCRHDRRTRRRFAVGVVPPRRHTSRRVAAPAATDSLKAA